MYQERRPTGQSPSSRTNSPLPLPRRATGLNSPLPARPGFLPRSSSLSLASTPSISTTNLANTLRASGSALRNELRSEPVADAPHPVDVLEIILDVKKADSSTVEADEVDLEELDTLSLGDLTSEELVSTTRKENVRKDVTSISLNPMEYNAEKARFEDLHKSIEACDQVLKSVETYLTGFQSDLGAVSAEIETLQSRSASLNSQLENRRVVEKLLGPLVEELSLSASAVRTIVDGPIDESWARALGELDKKSKAAEAKQKEQRKLKALEDVLPFLESLRNKAISRIRDYLVSQIKALRSPNMNAQTIQQQGFLRYKDLYTFLAAHQPQLAVDIYRAYLNTMRWFYHSQFTRYERSMHQIKLHALDKSDLLGQADDPSVRRNAKVPAAHDAFSIGRRMDVIKNPSAAALSSYVAEEDKSSHYLEVVFRSFNVAVVDNASFEYTFLSAFFSPAQSFHTVTRIFEGIYGHTFKLGQELTKSLVETSTDALGILLCVRLNQRFAFEFQRLKVPPGESYINATNMLLWPRFQKVMDMHCESLRKLSLTATSTAPHPVTQRFASFLQGLVSLSSEAADDEPVSKSMSRLRNDFEALMTKASKGIGDVRKRERFLFNNYSLVGTILEEASGKFAEENRKHFEDLKNAYGSELR